MNPGDSAEDSCGSTCEVGEGVTTEGSLTATIPPLYRAVI
jgi:hypothetical protein